jgi:Ca2+-binding RTX toxin-like protein
VTINLVSGAGDEVANSGKSVNWSGNVIENAIGGTASDSITGNTLANILNGGAGADMLIGGVGADTLIGGIGNDNMQGGADNDNYQGFTGTFGTDTINDLSGADILDLRNYNLSNVVSWSAVDSSDAGSFVDALVINFGSNKVITISNYFSNTSIDDDLSLVGSGYIETIAFADDPLVDFSQVKLIIP